MIIGLIGYKQVGKTTAADYLVEHHGFTKHNFKDALVAELKERFPDLLEVILNQRSRHDTYHTIDELFETKPPLVRALMMNYGTEVRRQDDPDYWVNEWYEKAAFYHDDMQSFVTDDVRFLNEARAIEDLGGVLIRLTRTDITTGGNHQSETEQSSIKADHTIKCQRGDHQHLYNELDKIIKGV